jgi:hypothetical protein
MSEFIYVIGDKVRCVGKTIFGHHNLEGTVKDIDYWEEYPILVSFLGYRDPVSCKASDLVLIKEEEEQEYTGGSSSYYDLTINGTEIRCLDIIEALGMNYAEGNAFKAIWRIAASKQGKQKKGNTRLYDAEKVVFFGERLVEEHSG